ncbi:hypothetical protein [Chitinophaga pinensis]|uniref:Uncharacterized protein n=1 Tax=Chitinophaga pinensis TaxID=79329 RepID=A0A5C6LS82_9BACT|nr:hypothetical protein [Chitinophaga pinensis]TWV98051.1 hypothetical protein FEF09_21010 [Chitinophaga pinensis]
MIPNDLHVCLEFFSLFVDPCKMEFCWDNGSWLFTVTLEDSAGNDKRSWTVRTADTQSVHELIELCRTVVTAARKDDRIILDGIGLTCSIMENSVQKVHDYCCPEEGHPEWRFAEAFVVQVQKLIRDQELANYIELLGGVFGRFPAKIFDETPRRLRIYGMLTIACYEELSALIEKVAGEQALVLDLTNLQGMGTVLYEQFEPLKLIRDLKIMVSADNKYALQQVKEIGFNAEQVMVVGR